MYSLPSAFGEWRGWVTTSGHSLPLTAVGAMFVIMGMVGKLTGAAKDQIGGTMA